MFRKLNRKTGTLIFNYIYYPHFFFDSIYSYLHYRNWNYHITQEWGYYLPIISTDLFRQKVVTKNNETYTKYIPETPRNPDLINAIHLILRGYNYSEGVNKLFNAINRLWIVGDYELISTLLDLAYNKDYFHFANIIVQHTISDRFSWQGYNVDPDQESLNILNSSVFIVKDINLLLDNVKKIGYSDIDQGPQPWRGQINSMCHFLLAIDTHYRNSLYEHYTHHMEQEQAHHSDDLRMGLHADRDYMMPGYDYLLPRSKFSFRNILMNIGSVKW